MADILTIEDLLAAPWKVAMEAVRERRIRVDAVGAEALAHSEHRSQLFRSRSRARLRP